MRLMLCFLLISASVFADTVRLVDDPDQAIKLRMHLLEEAKSEIQISYFIFHQDHTAMEMLALLREKARAGVKVRLILDEMFNKIPKAVETHLAEEGVEIKNFNKMNLLRPLRSAKFRLHDKLLIVDRSAVIMGGRNIQDSYYGRAKENYEDRDILVQGMMAHDAAKYFDELWVARHLKFKKPVTKDLAQAAALLDTYYTQFLNQPTNFSIDQVSSTPVEVEKISLFHDAVARKKKHFSGTSKSLFALMETAKKSIIIDSPYLIMTPELKRTLKKIIANGVSVRILTNSLKTNDGVVAHAGYLWDRKKFVRLGVELYEYYGEDRFHSKSLVIDDEIAVVGSYNFDPRSQNLNTETMGAFWDVNIARLLKESMDENIKVSLRIDRRGMAEGQTRKFPGVTTKKLVITKLLQFLIVPLAKDLL